MSPDIQSTFHCFSLSTKPQMMRENVAQESIVVVVWKVALCVKHWGLLYDGKEVQNTTAKYKHFN